MNDPDPGVLAIIVFLLILTMIMLGGDDWLRGERSRNWYERQGIEQPDMWYKE